ncbi:MAG TPA: YeeE/YedE thiosulfate transporter family protein [Stenomitos sp.]
MAAPQATAVATLAQPNWVRLGILFGLLSTLSIALFAPIGVSTTYPRVVGALLDKLMPGFEHASPYLSQLGGAMKGETFLVVGLLVGAFVAARLGRSRVSEVELVHANETGVSRRYLNAFLGGFLLLFGARLAGGCTSGHVISGISQLSLSGFVFAAGVFATGIVTAKLLKGGR